MFNDFNQNVHKYFYLLWASRINFEVFYLINLRHPRHHDTSSQFFIHTAADSSDSLVCWLTAVSQSLSDSVTHCWPAAGTTGVHNGLLLMCREPGTVHYFKCFTAVDKTTADSLIMNPIIYYNLQNTPILQN